MEGKGRKESFHGRLRILNAPFETSRHFLLLRLSCQNLASQRKPETKCNVKILHFCGRLNFLRSVF